MNNQAISFTLPVGQFKGPVENNGDTNLFSLLYEHDVKDGTSKENPSRWATFDCKYEYTFCFCNILVSINSLFLV